jgi:hypothetical protein
MGRHLHRTLQRTSLAAVVAAAVVVGLVLTGAPAAGAGAMVAATVALGLGACRLIAAHEADVGEERWLRDVLGRLREPDLDDEDSDLVV